jgi:hypothetical protein
MNTSIKPLAATVLVAGLLLGSTAQATASSPASTRGGGTEVGSSSAEPVQAFTRPRPCYWRKCAV